jgi:hypothetical protein
VKHLLALRAAHKEVKVMETECPSGLSGEIRGMKMREMALLTDAKLIRSGQLMTEMVKNCWVRTTKVGPYSFPSEPPNPLPWDQLLHADKLHAFKAIRIATFGADFEWEVQCPDGACAHRFLWSVQLDQLKATPLPAESVQHVTNGATLSTVVDGKKVRYRLLRGGDDRKLMQFTEKYNMPMLTAGYICRILDVEGIDADDPEALRNWLDDLDLAEGEKLQETMDSHEAAVGLRTISICPKCNEGWDVIVPLVQAFTRRKTPSGSKSAKTTTTSSEASLVSPGSTPKSEAPTSP